jgi:hypothetical protein
VRGRGGSRGTLSVSFNVIIAAHASGVRIITALLIQLRP